jgi:hypothetical protein
VILNIRRITPLLDGDLRERETERAARRERMKKLHADPAFAAAQRERMKKLHASK